MADDRLKDFQTTQGNYAPRVNAASRADPHVTGPYDTSSPSGTDWKQTFGNNNPYSPSGTNFGTTFARTNTGLAPDPTRNILNENPNYQGMRSNAVTRGAGEVGSPSGTDWNKTFGVNLAGDTTPPPSPGDIDDTFFGGPTPTPTPKPTPAIALYRNRMQNSTLTRHDYERYGAGSAFGLT